MASVGAGEGKRKASGADDAVSDSLSPIADRRYKYALSSQATPFREIGSPRPGRRHHQLQLALFTSPRRCIRFHFSLSARTQSSITMQRLLITASICVYAYFFASVALAAEEFDSMKVAPSNSMENDQMEKVLPDLQTIINQDLLEEQQLNLPRNPLLKWYLVKAAPFAGFRGSPGQLTHSLSPSLPLLVINRQLSKQHKKNPRSNPRDILRGLAVKRDHYYN